MFVRLVDNVYSIHIQGDNQWSGSHAVTIVPLISCDLGKALFTQREASQVSYQYQPSNHTLKDTPILYR